MGIGFRLLALLAAMMPLLPVRAEWHVASSAHFVVYSDDAVDRLRDFAARLERYDQAIRKLRQIPNDPISPSARVTVYMVGSVNDVERLLGRNGVAGFYIPRAAGSVAFVPRRDTGREPWDLKAESILFHEYAHHLMFAHWSALALPAWMVEGFAEFHATARFGEDGSVQFGAAPTERAWGLLTGNPLPVERLLASGQRAHRALETEAVYGRGWLLTHYLTFASERTGQLGRYVDAINAGATPAAASAAFGDLRALSGELSRYLRQPRLPAVTLAGDGLDVGPIDVRRLGDGAAEIMPVHMRSTRGVDERSARRVLADARRIAARHPSDAFVQRVLAEAEYDAGFLAEAAAAAKRATAADPTLIAAHVYRAMAGMAVAQMSGGGEADWRAARALLLAANRIEPDHPVPLQRFYHSFVQQGIAPSDNARAALFRAQELAPHDRGLRMTAASIRLDGGDADAARTLLRPVAYAPHGGTVGERAAQVLDRLDAGDIGAATALIRMAPAAEPAAEAADG